MSLPQKIITSDALPGLYALWQIAKGLPADKPLIQKAAHYAGETNESGSFDLFTNTYASNTLALRLLYVASIALNHVINNFGIKKQFPKLGLCGRIATTTAMLSHAVWYKRKINLPEKYSPQLDRLGPALIFAVTSIAIHIMYPSRKPIEQVISVVVGLAETALFIGATKLANRDFPLAPRMTSGI